MGATVSVGKKAGVYVRQNGDIVYVLFERTYEKNCYPHTPYWSAIAAGKYQDVMRHIYGRASECEGGILQGSNGLFLPENYISAWRRELTKPSRMVDITVDLCLGKTIYGSLTNDLNDDIGTKLVDLGFQSIWDELQAGKSVRINHHDHTDILLAFYGVLPGKMGAMIPPWKAFNINMVTEIQADGLAPYVVNDKVPVIPTYSVLRLDSENVLVKLGDLDYSMWGWQYSAVGRFIRDVAYDIEMISPKEAKKAISMFRDACKVANEVPGAAEVTIKTTLDSDVSSNPAYWERNAQELASRLGHQDGVKEFTVSLMNLREIQNFYLNHSLHESQMRWKILPSESMHTSHDEALSKRAAEQREMFAT